MDRRRTIIELNDQLRTTFRGGRVQMTPSVYGLDERLRGRALSALARYTKFHPDSEHDWGTFIVAGYSFEWRIEYRGKDGIGRSPELAAIREQMRADFSPSPQPIDITPPVVEPAPRPEPKPHVPEPGGDPGEPAESWP